MKRRLFAEKQYKITGHVVPFEDFRLFVDLPDGEKINPEHTQLAIERGEKWLTVDIPLLNASEYMMFAENGNRSVYEKKYFDRRSIMLDLALAEKLEGEGRFTKKLIDVVWHILEETTWVLPAHNQPMAGVNTCLPYAFREEVDYIDLFAATTGSSLAMVYHLCKEVFDSVTVLINQRILYELERRIIKPYLDDCAMWEHGLWSGIRGNVVNNWTPWIVSNVLSVCALTCSNLATRHIIIEKSMQYLDNYLVQCSEDGACEEGPGYWNVSGGALFNAGLVLYDMTNGYINIFKDPYMRKAGEFAVRAVISENQVINFADASAGAMPQPIVVYQWGQLCGSPEMQSYGAWKLGGKLTESRLNDYLCYRSLRFLTQERIPSTKYVPVKYFIFEKLGIAGSRQFTDLNKGLYLSLKGGSNAEGHNHNDVGSFIVFADGQPLFVDAGCGEYTKRTFSKERYTIWTMRSDYHNCATFNGVTQRDGLSYRARDYKYDEKTGAFSFELTDAYPEEAGLKCYKRGAVINGSRIEISDLVEFVGEGTVMFSLITLYPPGKLFDHSFVLCGKTICYDPILEYNIEALDKTWPETHNIPACWGVDTLYRITLTTKVPVNDRLFMFTVE